MIDSLRSSCIRIVWHQVGTNMVSVLERGASGVLGLPCPIVAITYKVKVAGQRTLYISVHDHEQPAEIFLRVKGSDCSSELIRLYYVIARLMSLALQYGAPLEKVDELLPGAKFAPGGPVLGHERIKHCTRLPDLIGRHLLIECCEREDLVPSRQVHVPTP